MKKGISTILGTAIFIQILVVALALAVLLVVHQTATTVKSEQNLHSLAQHAMIIESYENNQTYLVATSPFVITHVIYPNGTVTNDNITVKYSIPASKILGKEKWAVIVTNEGTWFNISVLNITTITLKPP